MNYTIHPLADEWGEEYLLLACASERVILTAHIRGFLLDARDAGLRPVLLTSTTAHLDWFVADELRLAGGYWAVTDPQLGVFDGRTGRRIHAIPDLWDPKPHSDRGLMSFEGYSPVVKGGLFFDVFTRERAEEKTQAFGVAEHMLSGLGGDRLVRWGSSEPLTQAWSRSDATAALRMQMPASERLFARGDGGAAVSVTMSRTASGLLEHTRGLVPSGEYGQPFGLPHGVRLGQHPLITETLTGLAERYRVNVAMVSYCEVVERSGSLGQLAELRRPDSPVAVLIGPVAARTLQINPEELARKYDAVPVGLRRAPSILVRFSSPDSLWRQFVEFGKDLDQERLAGLLAREFWETSQQQGE